VSITKCKQMACKKKQKPAACQLVNRLVHSLNCNPPIAHAPRHANTSLLFRITRDCANQKNQSTRILLLLVIQHRCAGSTATDAAASDAPAAVGRQCITQPPSRSDAHAATPSAISCPWALHRLPQQASLLSGTSPSLLTSRCSAQPANPKPTRYNDASKSPRHPPHVAHHRQLRKLPRTQQLLQHQHLPHCLPSSSKRASWPWPCPGR
jgi:hypothetical protein